MIETARVRIRPATADDAAGIVGVLNPIIAARTYTVFDTPLTVEAERAFITSFPPRGVFHIAVDEAAGEIVGLQNVEPVADFTHALDHVGSIATYVQLTRRRQGIATRLFEATFAAAREKGYEKAFTLVRADNPVALATYVRQGFRVIGRAERHAKIDGRYVDELLIERLL